MADCIQAAEPRDSSHPHSSGDPMRRTLAVPVARRLFFVPLLACACYSWSPVPLAPKVAAELPTHSRVVRKGGGRVQLVNARLTADSIIAPRGDTGRYAVSRDDVARVERRHFQPG